MKSHPTRSMRRRAFLVAPPGLVAVSAVGYYFRRRIAPAQEASAFDRAELSLLRETCRVLLPSSVAPVAKDLDEAVTGFNEWLRGYDPKAAINHANTTSFRSIPMKRRIAAAALDPKERLALGPSPLQRYKRDLRGISERAAQTGKPFAELPLEDRRRILAAVVSDAVKDPSIPTRPQGESLIVDVLSYFYFSPAAIDLCWQRQIGAFTCRGLDDVGVEPERLA